jgi:hypothetical protein
MSTLILVRKPGWPELLAHYLHTRAFLPFAWGLNDCALAPADWVRDCTGVDPMADLRGSYASSEEAARILARHGGLRTMVRERLPMYGNVLQAHRGDVVCVELEDPDTGKLRETLGVIAGNGCWAAPGETGLLYRPIAEVRLAYAVG